MTEADYQTHALKKIAAYSYVSRTFAYLAGLFIVIAIFQTSHSPFQDNAGIMSLLLLVCLVWPHTAFLWAKRSRNMYKAVTHSLLFDSFYGGLWIPLMGYELIPSAVFITILMINNISAGGFKLWSFGVFMILIGGLSTTLLFTPTLHLESKFIIVVFCIPLIVFYPMVLAYSNFKLTRLMMSQQKNLLHISQHDGLTGVFSRHYWEQRLLEEFDRCQRSGERACVMMVDVDHFKNINDNHGHLVGDEVLKEFGNLLNELRSSDIAGRYGGEEFAILLPNSDLEESLTVAERLREKIENTPFKHIDYCTVSIGVAQLTPQYSDAYKWLNHADQALYQAKEQGRNRVCTWLIPSAKKSSNTDSTVAI